MIIKKYFGYNFVNVLLLAEIIKNLFKYILIVAKTYITLILYNIT
jgi:hypothetical protein